MEKKITMMKLKVDLQCNKCHKKVKKVLCKFPQIRDQIYDEKKNMVTIKVVCCNPEMIRDKLCCKGGGSIKSIEILEPPTEPKKPQKPEKKPEEKKDAPGPKTKPPPIDDEPPLVDAAPPPRQPQPASKFPKPLPPVTVLAYPPPAPAAPVGWFHDGYYERPVYDSYGGGGSRYYVGHYEFDQNLNAENESVCTIM